MRYLTIICLLAMMAPRLVGGVPGWRLIQPLPEQRMGHDAVMMHDGNVLVLGGHGQNGAMLTTSHVIDGSTGTHRAIVGNDPAPRTHSAVVVVPLGPNSSAAYVIGGYTGSAGNYASSASVSRVRYDAPSAQWRWENVGTLPIAVGDCRAVFDGTGSIIVSGGRVQSGGAIGSGVLSTATASINISTGAIRRLGDHVTARSNHGAYRFIDQSGASVIMVAGGEPTLPPSTELLDGTTWDPRANAPLTDRRDGIPVSDITGTARVFGGVNASGVLNACEWYDPKSGWRTAPRMNQARSESDAALVAGPADTVAAYLVTAGRAATPLGSCEVFLLPDQSDPSGAWTSFEALNIAGVGRQVAMTTSNLPIVVGGESTATVECYQPLRIDNVGFPSTEVGARSDSVPVVVTNTWMLPVRIRSITMLDGADFILAVDTTEILLGAGRSRTILAWFRPSAPGVVTSRVVVNLGIISDTFTLTGNGLSSTVEVTTSVMDHGDVFVGTTNRLCLPVLKNNGSDTAWVDSIVIDPPGSFILESPIGRTAVAPGEELTVCTLFKPTARGVVAGTATMHIGPRAYSAAVLGYGVRTYAFLQDQACDTVSAQRDETVIASAVIENAGDFDVTVTDVTLSTSIPDIARLADPNLIPFTLRAGEIIVVDVELTVQREGEERIQVSAESNSDEDIEGVLCIVVRARSVVPNVSSVNVGQLCVGDTVISTVVVTNASAVEAIQVSDIVVENTAQALVSPAGPITIAPRSSAVLTVTVAASQPGPLDGRVVVNSQHGSTSVPIYGTVLDAVAIDLPDGRFAPGTTQQFPMTLSGTMGQEVVLDLLFAHDLLNITGIASVAGQTGIDPSSYVERHADRTTIHIVWSGAPPTTPTSVALVMEALRGADVVTDLRVARSADSGACVVSDTGTIHVDPNCGQERSLVTPGQGADVSLAPSPATSIITVRIAAVDRTGLVIRIIDAAGTLVTSHSVTTGEQGIDVATLPSGLYTIQLLSTYGMEDHEQLIITK